MCCRGASRGREEEEEEEEEEKEEEEEEGEIQEATAVQEEKGAFKPLQPKDNRDALLYRVTEITPPPRQLGNFKLGPSAACGDLISARVRMDDGSPKEEQTFVIKKVSCVYEFQRGAYRMVGKRAGVRRRVAMLSSGIEPHAAR